MAQRRQFFESSFVKTPTPMTPSGGSKAYGNDSASNSSTAPPVPPMESFDSFRHRTTPATGNPQASRTQLGEILAMLQGGQ